MPGPSSAKRQKKQQAKKARRKEPDAATASATAPPQALDDTTSTVASGARDAAKILAQAQKNTDARYSTLVERLAAAADTMTPAPAPPPAPTRERKARMSAVEASVLKKPFIEDPGNGPRVKDAAAFLKSFFAPPPSLEDPYCRLFARADVLATIRRILPEELALILWYNKTRQLGRICPACQRLYKLGDVLPKHIESELDVEEIPPTNVTREQQLSGLCSSMCFIVASFNYPRIISKIWGRAADELDEETCGVLNGRGEGLDDVGLGMLLRMTRLHDLGLSQLLEFRSDDGS